MLKTQRFSQPALQFTSIGFLVDPDLQQLHAQGVGGCAAARYSAHTLTWPAIRTLDSGRRRRHSYLKYETQAKWNLVNFDQSEQLLRGTLTA